MMRRLPRGAPVDYVHASNDLRAGVTGNQKQRAIKDRETLRTVVKSLLVDREQVQIVAARHGLKPDLVSKIRTGASYSSDRAEVIKELRAEGHTVHLV